MTVKQKKSLVRQWLPYAIDYCAKEDMENGVTASEKELKAFAKYRLECMSDDDWENFLENMKDAFEHFYLD